jgi:hypothetical protein
MRPRHPKTLYEGPGWLLLLAAMFVGHEGLSWWQGIQVYLVALSVRFTSLLVYLGASLKASEIMSLVVGISGIATFMVWVSKGWHHVKSDGMDEATSPHITSPRKKPAHSKTKPRSSGRKPRSA